MTLTSTRRCWRTTSFWVPALLSVALAACSGSSRSAATATLTVKQGTIVQEVSGSGLLQPARESFLNFVTNGTVASVNVVEGQAVVSGTVLAALDTSDLDQQIRQAEANLKSAQANLLALQDGPDETDLRNAQAQLEAAQIQFSQAANGNVRPGDVVSAQAQLDAARAQRDALYTPSETDRQAAQIKLTEAQTALQAARDNSSNTKTQAELALQQASQSLTQAQTDYSAAYWDWQWVQDNNSAPGSRGGSLSDFERQEYYNAFQKAEAALHTAEDNVEKARVTLENTRQQEVSNVQQAEQQVAEAQRQIDALGTPTPDQVAQAEAQIAQAEAQLAQLTGGGTELDVALAQTTIQQRQAAIDALLAPPENAEVAQAEAQVAQAEAQLAQARRSRANAELVAPFDGTVASVNLTLGDSSTEGAANSSGEAAIYLVDATRFHVEVNISEVDLAQLKTGQVAQVTLDALPGEVLTGTLSTIALVPTVEQNVTTYAARIDLEPTKLPLRVGMSATVNIVTAEIRDAILVPNIAIQQTPDGPQVSLQRGEETISTTVELGLAGESETEVRSGLKPGDVLVVTVPSGTSQQNGFRFPGGPPPGGGGGGGGGGRP